jgi:hypothetical protein
MNKLNKTYMHEYGHYIQSQNMGWAFLPKVGIPSFLSAMRSKELPYPPYSTHSLHRVEKGANKKAKEYFKMFYGVDWNSPYQPYWWIPGTTIEDYYPTR